MSRAAPLRAVPGPPRPARLRAGLVVAVVCALFLLCVGGASSAVLFSLAEEEDPLGLSGTGCGRSVPVNANGELPAVGGLDGDQVHNAAVIIQVGQARDVPPRGWVIAVATAMQESWLRNLPHLGAGNDHDSVGLFQQRPSQGWGTPDQLLDPEYAAGKFFEKLVQVPGWDRMPLTDAAQRVQKSAYPDAYADDEPLATTVVDALTGGGARAVGSLASLRCVSAGEIAASGWTVPVRAAFVGSGFRTPARPNHQGVDLIAARDSEVYAATSGEVLVSECNSSDGCVGDGGVNVRGCGWYVDILHAGGVITRYCHLGRRPLVVVGQMVTAGELLGFVGSTGHSSGPHLHFEVHLDADASASGAVNPVSFMADVGAPLGVS